MTTTVSAIEAIEKLARDTALEVFANAVDSDDDSHSLDTPVAVAIIRDALAPLARQAEALERENAQKNAMIALAENALDKIVARADGGTVVSGQSLEMTGTRVRFLEQDIRDIARRARALLGGENAE